MVADDDGIAVGFTPKHMEVMLIEEHHIEAFHPTLIHGLLEDDYDRQLEFCENWLHKLGNQPELEDFVLWSDEFTFHLDGHINRHNCVY
uniref:Uncharacterized protein n=1 Tax=Romanomermis culicivorax TaxID=13658 RepID=A0A915I5P4_ROMCU